MRRQELGFFDCIWSLAFFSYYIRKLFIDLVSLCSMFREDRLRPPICKFTEMTPSLRVLSKRTLLMMRTRSNQTCFISWLSNNPLPKRVYKPVSLWRPWLNKNENSVVFEPSPQSLYDLLSLFL